MLRAVINNKNIFEDLESEGITLGSTTQLKVLPKLQDKLQCMSFHQLQKHFRRLMKDLKVKFNERKPGWWSEGLPFKTLPKPKGFNGELFLFELRLCLSLYGFYYIGTCRQRLLLEVVMYII